MKLIEQKDDSGCGLACIAMLSGLNYDDVKKLATEGKVECHFSSPKKTFYTSSAHLITLAKKTKKISITSTRRMKFKSVDELPARAILSLPIAKEPKKWHWVVFERLKNEKVRVYDSEIPKMYVNLSDIENLKITHYLEVT